QAFDIGRSGEDVSENARFLHYPEDLRSRRSRQQAQRFITDALPRKLVEAGLQPRAGVETILVQPAAGMDGGKAEEAQDAEIILANAVRGIADETHPARPQVVHALPWIENRPVSVA